MNKIDRDKKQEIVEAYKNRKVIGGICAVKNLQTGRMLLSATTDLQGYKNRFEFCRATNMSIHYKLNSDWAKTGADNFVLVVLEELEKEEMQTPREFTEDIEVLKEMWLEKTDLSVLY